MNEKHLRKIGRADQLQFLRFLAFLLIFCWHGDIWMPNWAPKGNGAYAAVSFFFILSGLVIGYSSYEKEITLSFSSIGKDIWKRIKKFYPLYFATTIFAITFWGIPAFIAYHHFAHLKEILMSLMKNIFMVQSWFTTNHFMFNGVGWFLSTIMFLYLLNVPATYALNKLSKRKNRYIIFLLMFTVLMALTVIYCYSTKDIDMQYWQYIFPPARMGEYFGGMIVGFVIRMFLSSLKDSPKTTWLFTLLEILALCFWIYVLYQPSCAWSYRVAHWLLPNFVLLCIFTFGKGLLSGIFRIKYLKVLGDISFECYIIHQVVQKIYISMSDVGDISTLGNLFSLAFCLGIVILFAYLLNGRPLEKNCIDQ